MKTDWYKLLAASRPAAPVAPKAPEPLTEGRGLPMFGYGDFSGAYYGAASLSPDSVRKIFRGIADDIVTASAPKLPDNLSVPELDRLGPDTTPDAAPVDYDVQASLGSQFMFAVTDAWLLRTMRDFLSMLNSGMNAPQIDDAIQVLSDKMSRYVDTGTADGSMATTDLQQEILEVFRQSQMETVLLSHDTIQIMGPVVLDVENAALCVRIHQDYSFKLYPLAIDHQVLRAVIYAASEPHFGRNNIFIGLANLAQAIPNPIFAWLGQPLRGTETDASIIGYKHDPMSSTNYGTNYSQNPDVFHAITVQGYASDDRFNPSPEGSPRTPSPDYTRQVGFDADAGLPMASRAASGPDDTTATPLLNSELTFTNFCRVNENMGRDLGILAALLDLVTVDPSTSLRAQKLMLDRLHELKDWMLRVRTGKTLTTAETNWTGAPTLVNPMLVISNPEVLGSNQWDITTAKDGAESKRFREASAKLADFLDAVKGKQPTLEDLVGRYKKVKGMIDFIVTPMFANPMSVYGLARFDLLSAEAKTLLEGVFDFIGQFYLDLFTAVGTLPPEVMGAEINKKGHTVEFARDRALGAGTFPRTVLLPKLAALKVMGDGVFLPNVQAFLQALDEAFGQPVVSGVDFRKKDVMAKLAAPIFFIWPIGELGVGAALLGRMLATDQTILATPEDKDQFLLDVRQDGALFAQSMEATMRAQTRVVNLAGFESEQTADGQRKVSTPTPTPADVQVPMTAGDMLSQLVAKPSRVLQVSAVLINKARSLYHSLAALR